MLRDYFDGFIRDRLHYPIAMAEVDHPDTGESIDVEIIDRASHHGEYVQVQAVEDGIELHDESGEAPWLDADEVRGA